MKSCRMPMTGEGRCGTRRLSLADRIAERLTPTAEPVRIVGHSAGGLLALAAFALRPQLWREFTAKPGCRLLLLGTPWHGSLAAARALLGEERLVACLALLDIQRDEEELLRFSVPILVSWSCCRPTPRSTFWHPRPGIGCNGQNPGLGPARGRCPGQGARDAQPARRPCTDRQHVLYVAVLLRRRRSALRLARATFASSATARGDGRVSWDTIPCRLERWYVDAEHGLLAAHAASFPGYAELLQNGTTTRCRARRR